MQDSAPPAIIMFASPCWMKRAASPIEWAPVVQAVVAVWFGPCERCCCEYNSGLAEG